MRRLATLVVSVLVVAGCISAMPPGGTPGSAPPASPAASGASSMRPAPTGELAGRFDIGGYSLFIDCKGSGSTTVVLEAGLGSGPFVWSGTQQALAAATRVCMYARAGMAPSDNRPRGTATKEGLSAGFMAGETYKLLQAAGIPGPYVLVGHSYGGMLVRLFAFAHPDQVAGVVLVDSSSAHQFEGEWLAGDNDWFDGPTLVNRVASATELDAITSLGSIPLVVLTQSELTGDFGRAWAQFQDELATLSTNSLHMVADPSGHMIMDDQGPLLIESIKAVLDAAASHAPLPPCAPRFQALHALCPQSTSASPGPSS
jgi:alpha/beta hydrolase fold